MSDIRGVPGASGNIGHLYYVRLNTPLGKFYKIGFTTMKSVNDRLAFQGTGDEKYIDEVLYFNFRLGALSLEQSLHSYFAEKAAFHKYSAYADLPLSKNGQSELYYEDVLELDNKYTPAQAEETRKAVELAITMRTYTSEVWAKRVIVFSNIALNALMVVAKTIGWSIKKIQAIAGIKTATIELPPSVLEDQKKVRLFLAELQREKKMKSLRLHRELTMFRLIHAFSNQNLEDLMKIIKIEELGRDIANSIALDLQMFSDYLCIPNNCCMFALMEHMNHENCHELLIKPVVDSYIPMIKEFVVTRKISDMSIHLPNEPIYAVDPEYNDCDIKFDDYFGAQEFIGLLECCYISKSAFKHNDAEASVEFSIEIEDKETARRFLLRIIASFKNRSPRLTFPNLNELIREFREQREKDSQFAN